MRLNKYLASCGVASRRNSEKLICSGRVSVNGRLVTDLSTRVDEVEDEVKVDGELVKPTTKKLYVLLHKPKGYVTTVTDPYNRPTVMDLVKIDVRLYPVGRLDVDTEGALLLTNDGELTHRLLHPKYKIKKRYVVQVQRPVAENDINKLEHGIVLEDGVTAPCEIAYHKNSDAGNVVEIVLHEGRKRQIKRMFSALGYEVEELRRIAFGPLILDDLPAGKWRYLKEEETEKLRADKGMVIAIDGVAASGKSTTAKRVARALRYLYLDSGALYRAVTLEVVQKEIDPRDRERVASLAADVDIQLIQDGERTKVLLNGVDVSEKIRSTEVTQNIGPVAANQGVREAMVRKQRTFAERGSVVADGRDIGTVVFPNADLKFFFTASLEERAKRRARELDAMRIKTSQRQLKGQLKKRDEDDSSRQYGPLAKAEDAIEVDTSFLTIDEQVAIVLKEVNRI